MLSSLSSKRKLNLKMKLTKEMTMKIKQTGKELLDEMRAVARGDRLAPPRPAAQTLSALTTEALALLSTMAEQKPSSVSELAKLSGRTQPNVSRSLHLLAKYGIVRLVRDGREVRPELLATRIAIDLSTGTVEPAEPREFAA
jgi:DNA-binding transcriptional ArsR family regulator